MKPTALLINTSRAELIQPGALLAALQAGRPGYAAVDVYEQEPMTGGNHPFLSMPNVLCTPHLGGRSATTSNSISMSAFDQIVAYARGEPLRLAPALGLRQADAAGRQPPPSLQGKTA